MKYLYEDLSDEQFESLIVLLCQYLLGAAVQGFAKGPDGGRDAKFFGTAQLIPSERDPWKGKIIIQAKHINSYNRSFSDSDFFKPDGQNTVLGKEIPRIKALREQGELDYYMLFANRRLTANSEAKIRKAISIACHLPENAVLLCGIEQLEMWLRRFPKVAEEADLDPWDSPLIITPDELAEIIESLVEQKDCLLLAVDTPPAIRVEYEKKNNDNNMSSEYAKMMLKKYLKYSIQIQEFLADPVNIKLLNKYQVIVEEIEFKIIAHRKSYQLFDHMMNYLADLLIKRDPILRKNQRLTRAMLFYMYWNCDIGGSNDIAAN